MYKENVPKKLFICLFNDIKAASNLNSNLNFKNI